MENINVLIIDDEEQIVKSFKAHFRTIYNVHTATNIADAKEILAQHTIHVVLCDYQMPDKDGIIFFSEILVSHPAITRILITAYDSVSIAIEAINIGSIYKYVQKPWVLDELKASIDQSYNYYLLIKEKQDLVERLLSNDRLIKILEGDKK
jgi:DNA-binding NtrC family response regulator